MQKSARQRTQRRCSSALALEGASLRGRQGDAGVQAGEGHGYPASWRGKGKEEGTVTSGLRATSCCRSSLPAPGCAHPGGHVGQAGVEVRAPEGDAVLTPVPSPAGPRETPWVLLVRAEPPLRADHRSDRPQDKALASLPRRGDGKGAAVLRLRPCSRGQAASSPGSGAQLRARRSGTGVLPARKG